LSKLLGGDQFLVPTTLSMYGCGVDIKALVDTGANGFLFIHSSLARYLSQALGAKTYNLPYSVPIRGYNSKVQNTINQFIRLHLTVEGRLIKNCPMLILDLGDQDMILGIKWLRRFRIKLDPYHNRFTWPSCYPPTPSWERILRVPYPIGPPQTERDS
jgi:predicted aspartyl protease